MIRETDLEAELKKIDKITTSFQKGLLGPYSVRTNWGIKLNKYETHFINNYISCACSLLRKTAKELSCELTPEIMEEMFIHFHLNHDKPKNWDNEFPEWKAYSDSLTRVCERIKK